MALLIDAAKKLESIGAEGLIIYPNVMHKVSNDVAAAVNMPVLHVVDAIGSNLKATEINKVALLATKSADRKQLLPRAAGRAFRTGCSCAGTRGNGVGQLYYF